MGFVHVRPSPSESSAGDPPDPPVPDVDLMERVREGDVDAYRELLGRHWERLVDYAAGFMGGTDEGEDVAQEVFARVWRRRERWRPSGSVSAYLYRITRNVAINRLESGRARKARERLAEVVHHHYGAPPRTPQDAFEARRRRALVDEAISDLPARRREVFVLARIHGLSHREIAEALSISTQTVANQMSAALSQLRRALSHLL